MRKFLSANRYPAATLLISLTLIVLQLVWTHMMYGVPPLDEELNFSRPTHIEKHIYVFAENRYWLFLDFDSRGRSYDELEETFGDQFNHPGITFPVNILLQKSASGPSTIDQKIDAKGTQAISRSITRRMLGTEQLDSGLYKVQIDIPEVPELAAENANLKLRIDSKPKSTEDTNLNDEGAMVCVFVIAPMAFIAFTLLVIRMVAVLLRKHASR